MSVKEISFLFTLIGTITFAQPARKILATSGRVAKNLNPSLFQTKSMEYTLGEPITMTSLTNGKRLNCGFIQPDGNFAVANPSLGAGNTAVLSATLYPNPTDHVLSIQTNFAPEVHFEIQLIDLNGKLLSIYQMNSNLFQICDLSLTSGIYLLNFYDSFGKFLLQKELSVF